MLGKIEEIIDNQVTIRLDIDISEQPSLINLHVIFDNDEAKKIVAEVSNVNQEYMFANIVGEITNGMFTPGATTKPSFKSKVRLINMEE